MAASPTVSRSDASGCQPARSGRSIDSHSLQVRTSSVLRSRLDRTRVRTALQSTTYNMLLLTDELSTPGTGQHAVDADKAWQHPQIQQQCNDVRSLRRASEAAGGDRRSAAPPGQRPGPGVAPPGTPAAAAAKPCGPRAKRAPQRRPPWRRVSRCSVRRMLQHSKRLRCCSPVSWRAAVTGLLCQHPLYFLHPMCHRGLLLQQMWHTTIRRGAQGMHAGQMFRCGGWLEGGHAWADPPCSGGGAAGAARPRCAAARARWRIPLPCGSGGGSICHAHQPRPAGGERCRVLAHAVVLSISWHLHHKGLLVLPGSTWQSPDVLPSVCCLSHVAGCLASSPLRHTGCAPCRAV